MKLFMCSSGFSFGWYCQKILGDQNFCTLCTKMFKSWIEGWIILGQIGLKLSICLKKGFFEKTD